MQLCNGMEFELRRRSGLPGLSQAWSVMMWCDAAVVLDWCASAANGW